MITVSRGSELDADARVYFVDVQTFAPAFTQVVIPELTAAYERFFIDNDIKYVTDSTGSAVTADFKLSDEHSWFWRFLCKRTEPGAPVVIPKSPLCTRTCPISTTPNASMPPLANPRSPSNPQHPTNPPLNKIGA